MLQMYGRKKVIGWLGYKIGGRFIDHHKKSKNLHTLLDKLSTSYFTAFNLYFWLSHLQSKYKYIA